MLAYGLLSLTTTLLIRTLHAEHCRELDYPSILRYCIVERVSHMICVILLDENLSVKIAQTDASAKELRSSIFNYSESLDCARTLKLLLTQPVETLIFSSLYDADPRASTHELFGSLSRLSAALGVKFLRLLISKRGEVYFCTPISDAKMCTLQGWFGNTATALMCRAVSCSGLLEETMCTSSLARAFMAPKTATDLILQHSSKLPLIECCHLFGITFVYALPSRCMLHMQKDNNDLANSILDAITAMDRLESLGENFVHEQNRFRQYMCLLCCKRSGVYGSASKRSLAVTSSFCGLLAVESCTHMLVHAHEPVLMEMKKQIGITALNHLRLTLNSMIDITRIGRVSGCGVDLDVFVWKKGLSQKLDLQRSGLHSLVQEIFSVIVMKQRALGLQSRHLVYKRHIGFIWFVKTADIIMCNISRYMHQTSGCSIMASARKGISHDSFTQLSCDELDCLNFRFEAMLVESYKSCELIYRELRFFLDGVMTNIDNVMHGLRFLGALLRRRPLPLHVQPSLNSREILLLARAANVMFEEICEPHSILLTRCLPFILISGPNMSGKSTCIQNIANTVQLILSTRHVRATDANCALFDYAIRYNPSSGGLFTSHFFSDLKRLYTVIKLSTSNSLVLLDEPCKSTSPKEAEYALWVFLESMLRRRSKLVIVSHLQAIDAFAGIYVTPQLMTPEFVVKNGKFMFRYRLLKREHSLSCDYGMSQAIFSKLPRKILNRASALESTLRSSLSLPCEIITGTREKHEAVTIAQEIMFQLTRDQARHTGRHQDFMKVIACIQEARSKT